MYSVVLMAALTTSVDLPDKRGGCGGCHGGNAGCRGGGGRRGGRHGGGGGCCGCYGGGYGGGCMGMGMGMGYGGGCYGGGMGMGMGYGGGCYGGGMMHGGGIIMQGATQQSGEKIRTAPGEKKIKEESLLPAPATILVQLPADAKLLIDNEATTSTGSSRVFQSPVLKTGKEYHYTLKAEVIRNGKPVQAEQVVAVKAGVITPVTLTLPPAGVAQR